MLKQSLLLLYIGVTGAANAQSTSGSSAPRFTDSVFIKLHPSYNQVSGIHRWLFGENFRKEWAAQVKLPVIDIKQVNGGLKPLKFGGGMETKSIRMMDVTGKEWVIRSVEKIPDKLLPENLRGTFAVDWVDDEYSGQHPYSALIVPPLAEAAQVPHADPAIGVLKADPSMGKFSDDFAGRVVLIEEREPAGKSDNTFKAFKEIYSNASVRLDKKEVLRARMLDLLIGDWDRHEDQWRWATSTNGKENVYVAVPRDRDQVFHVTEGLFPSIAQLPWLDPLLGNFDGEIPHVKYSLYKTKFVQPYPDAQFTYEEWMQTVNDFVASETDVVLENAIKRLPWAVYEMRHTELLAILKERRDHLPEAMAEYYHFINKIVDLRLTNKDEQIEITDGPANGLHVVIKSQAKPQLLVDMTYKADITRELRLYLMAGDDQVKIHTDSATIKLRIVDSAGNKTFDVAKSNRNIAVYGNQKPYRITGEVSRIQTHISSDTLISRFVPTNHYNLWMPLATAAVNLDDGFLLGLGFRYYGRDGFRKSPSSTIQEFMITHSFATNAFRIAYKGQWTEAVGKADLLLSAKINAPDNTVNFFGQGNETVLVKGDDYRRHYRSRFDFYRLDPALKWATGKDESFTVGPSLQYYNLNAAENADRSIYAKGIVTSYDSVTLDKNRIHLGLVASFESDQRNNKILPIAGYLTTTDVQAYTGLNSYSRAFIDIRSSFTYYQKLDSAGIFVLSDRVGGSVAFGSPAFYQSGFLGGQGNLLGYLENRFAGRHTFYNNFQGRLRLANIGGYIFPGQLGITGFYDIGRVWDKDDHNDIWHQGTGGGVYFAPASLTVLQVLAAHSKEGWYPYISLNFRL